MAPEMLPENLRGRGGAWENQGLDELESSRIFTLFNDGLIKKDGRAKGPGGSPETAAGFGLVIWQSSG
ncbi:hypothetical protein CCMA1212_004398 [Trichoderma ghanense]|uniref:Uncharacterized protein n=1 Tax=Trichoderma ghanense TaxID=65468 RepID=A0ABY2HA35_9HYPO